MSLRETSPGVFYSDIATVSVGANELAFLLQEARRSDKHRARICAHPDVGAPVHEMVICLLRECYIRPHSHVKSESLHLIKGCCDLVLFDPGGRITNVVTLGEFPENVRYIRLSPRSFHTLIVRSEDVIFHETTPGPFRREDTSYADWAPSESETKLGRQYVQELDESISTTRTSRRDE